MTTEREWELIKEEWEMAFFSGLPDDVIKRRLKQITEEKARLQLDRIESNTSYGYSYDGWIKPPKNKQHYSTYLKKAAFILAMPFLAIIIAIVSYGLAKVSLYGTIKYIAFLEYVFDIYFRILNYLGIF